MTMESKIFANVLNTKPKTKSVSNDENKGHRQNKRDRINGGTFARHSSMLVWLLYNTWRKVETFLPGFCGFSDFVVWVYFEIVQKKDWKILLRFWGYANMLMFMQ